MENLVFVLQTIVVVYLLAGLLTSLYLHRSLSAIDSGVRGAGILFRLLITPGMLALWPVLLLTLISKRKGEAEYGLVESKLPPRRLRSTHGWLVKILIILMPIVILIAAFVRVSPTVQETKEVFSTESTFDGD